MCVMAHIQALLDEAATAPMSFLPLELYQCCCMLPKEILMLVPDCLRRCAMKDKVLFIPKVATLA